MGEKDIAEKILEDYPDVFADIVNGFLFDGEEVIKPEELEDMPGRSAYRAEKKLHDMERDVAKRWKKNDIRIACVGFENQTAPDPLMVLRVLGYDGAEYRAQCLKENEDKPPYPVITLVLYFGCERRWTEAKTLNEAVNVPELFKPYITNTKINVFEVAWLEEDQVRRFKSDFRIVADYFVQKRKTGAYIAS
ncbi:MAG: Rpn family recombination-promoting nuclease/putative transposase, partial [Acidaminococcaceae bacterium]|nr:Rpn family recombination-promoting nuclease/putative transposase [Acidaminococcaceae bacterium]